VKANVPNLGMDTDLPLLIHFMMYVPREIQARPSSSLSVKIPYKIDILNGSILYRESDLAATSSSKLNCLVVGRDVVELIVQLRLFMFDKIYSENINLLPISTNRIFIHSNT
jgi:hypothetical protein